MNASRIQAAIGVIHRQARVERAQRAGDAGAAERALMTVGVSGAPLATVMFVMIVQSRSSLPLKPLVRAPPRAPMPVLNCIIAFSVCVRMPLVRARSAFEILPVLRDHRRAAAPAAASAAARRSVIDRVGVRVASGCRQKPLRKRRCNCSQRLFAMVLPPEVM